MVNKEPNAKTEAVVVVQPQRRSSNAAPVVIIVLSLKSVLLALIFTRASIFGRVPINNERSSVGSRVFATQAFWHSGLDILVREFRFIQFIHT